MKLMSRNILAFVACLLMLLVLPRNAFSATHYVTACGTAITTSGLWLVDNDLTCSGNAIDVQVSNVTLKLEEHTITGISSGTAYGVSVASAANLSVKNVTILGPGKITGFTTGIDFYGTVGGGATDVQLTGNGFAIFMMADSVGVLASGLLISQNDVTSNSSAGIFCGATTKTTIVGNNVTSNSGTGIYLFEVTNSSILGNVSNSNSTDGIELGLAGANDSGNTIEGNITNYNLHDGIEVIPSATGNHFVGNVAFLNGVLDISESNASCATETYKSDVFGTANLTCVK